jgi:hypothetical protein
MNWTQKIVNREAMPKNVYYAYIQEGKALRRHETCAFVETEKALAFETLEQVNHFVNTFKRGVHNDYREAALKGDYTFWVIDKCPSGYYADDIKMETEWEPFNLFH